VLENWYGTLGVVYRFTRGHLVPFATANVGAYRYTKEDVFPSGGPVIDGERQSPYNIVHQTSGTDFGGNIGGGIEYFMGDDVSMSAEVLLHSIWGEVSSEVLDVTVTFRFLPQAN
jgi:hypothetical protein